MNPYAEILFRIASQEGIANGAEMLWCHYRIKDGMTFALASRPASEIEVETLERVAIGDYSDDICHEMVLECIEKLMRESEIVVMWRHAQFTQTGGAA